MTSLFDSLVLCTIVSGVAIVAAIILLVFAGVAYSRGDRLGAAALCLAATTCTLVSAVFAFLYARIQDTVGAFNIATLALTVLFVLVQLGIYLRVRAAVDSDERAVE